MNLEAPMSPVATPDRTITKSARSTSKRVWAGRVLSGLLVLFFLFDAGCKLLRLPMVIEASAKLGFSENAIVAIGTILLVCTIAYAVPRTAVLGAVLLTGYLGGAICTHVRSFEGAFPIVFATVFGILVWLGLGLRDDRVRALIAPPA